MFRFLNTGHVIVLFRTASFKFCLVHVHTYAQKDKVSSSPATSIKKSKQQAKEVYTSQSSATRKTGGGGYSRNVYTGRLRPEVQPLTLLYTILHEKGSPFVYLLMTDSTCFT